jgi:tRNA (guanine-N7-)-methyltransferase
MTNFNEGFKRPNLNKTKSLKRPNDYTQALLNEYATFAFDEEDAPLNKGQWRSSMGLTDNTSIDLEIGLGNGLHFAHHATTFADRGIIGVELKYKPLIQSIRRAVNAGAKYARAIRYHAFNLDLVFDAQEINDIFVFFPDPWTSPRKPDNRILNPRMIQLLFSRQRPGSRLYFKTDSEEAFDWCLDKFQKSPYLVNFVTRNLHSSDRAPTNFVTQFESLFVRKGLPIYYLEAQKPHE